jgi:uncharacterized membrane protein YeaQ/YmgE (transglycosylase-associated protein family)
MMWSITDLVIQTIGGFLGAHGAAAAMKESSFGFIGRTIAGLVGGALSGCFLQTLAATMVTGAGNLQEPRFVDQMVLQGLTGAVVGGISMLVVGFLKQNADQAKSKKS